MNTCGIVAVSVAAIIMHAILYDSIYVVNVDEPPNPVLNNLYLTEVTGPMKINLTTIDSTDPLDNYTKLVAICLQSSSVHLVLLLILIHLFCSASLVFTPVNAEIELISFSGPDPQGIRVIRADYNIVSLTSTEPELTCLLCVILDCCWFGE